MTYCINRLSVYIFFSLLAIKSFANPNLLRYYELTNEVKYRIKTGDFKKAIKAMDDAYYLQPTVTLHFIDEYYYAILCSKFDRKEEAFTHILRCFEKQPLPILDIWDYRNDSSIVLKDSAFGFINSCNSSRIVIEKRVKSLLDSFNHSEARNLLDSANYYWVNDAWYYSIQNRNQMKKNSRLSFLVDSSLGNHEELQAKVVNFIERRGTINVHNSSSEKFFTCISHLSKERKDRIVPILQKEWNEGKLPPSDWGFFLERRIMDDYDSSDCWGYFVLNCDCKSSSWSTVIENRRKIGMSVYLDQGDYMMNLDAMRTELPWVGTLIK